MYGGQSHSSVPSPRALQAQSPPPWHSRVDEPHGFWSSSKQFDTSSAGARHRELSGPLPAGQTSRKPSGLHGGGPVCPVQKWDKQTTDKTAIKKILEKSFAHAQETITAVPDADLEKKISFFGKEMSERTAMMGLLAHASEHLGQSIAYARSNKITPPWSKKEK